MVSKDSRPVQREREVSNGGSAGASPESRNEAKWTDRLVGAGSLLTLIYQIAYLAFDKRLSWNQPWPLYLHLFNIGLFFVAVLLTLKVGPWMRQHWKAVAFTFSVLLIASSTALAIITDELQPLFIALVLFLAGTGPFLAWGEWTQGLLSLVALAAFAIAVAVLPPHSSNSYRWLGIVIAAAIGLSSTALERRLRRARRFAEEEARTSREILLTQDGIRLAGQLVSGIAHDLNNTLSVARLRLDGLMQDPAVLSAHDRDLQSLKGAVEDAILTVARVRDLGRKPGSNRIESTQLAEVVRQAIELARTTIEGNSSLEGAPIRIISHVPRFLPPVNGPASELRQVFLNLLINAYQAIERRGEIVIDSSVKDDSIFVTVADSGPGISPDQLEQIFDPFFTTKGPHGTGLGLAIAKNILESLGGKIRASNRPGHGAVFTLEFPTVRHRGAVAAEAAPANVRTGSHFLLIDDDDENLSALRAALLRRGHTADAVQSGPEAIQKINSTSPYDVILCDLTMPGMNGWEVARLALKANPQLNFYIVTGWGQQLQSEVARDLPIRGVLSKPVDLDQLDRIASGEPC